MIFMLRKSPEFHQISYYLLPILLKISSVSSQQAVLTRLTSCEWQNSLDPHLLLPGTKKLDTFSRTELVPRGGVRVSAICCHKNWTIQTAPERSACSQMDSIGMVKKTFLSRGFFRRVHFLRLPTVLCKSRLVSLLCFVIEVLWLATQNSPLTFPWRFQATSKSGDWKRQKRKRFGARKGS